MKRLYVIIFTATFFISLIVYIAYRNFVHVEAGLEGHFNADQSVLVKYIANSIERQVENIQTQVMLTSLLPSIQNGDSKCLADMEEAYNELRGKIKCLYRLDGNESITHVSPELCIKQIAIKPSYFLEDPAVELRRTNRSKAEVGFEKQEADAPDKAIIIFTPIFDEQGLAAVIGACLDLPSIIREDIRPEAILSQKSAYIWILNDQGNFIFHPDKKFVGQNVFAVTQEMQDTLAISFEKQNRILREEMMKGKTGTDSYISSWHWGEEEKTLWLIAYCPFRIMDRQYSLALVMPPSEITSLTRKNFHRTLFLVGSVCTIGFIWLLLTLFLDQKRMKHLEEQRQLGIKMKESRDYLQSLLETANDVIITTDTKGYITYLNPRIDDYGYTVDELLGRHFLTTLSETHHERPFEDTVRQRAQHTFNVEVKTRDGEIRICRVSISPILDHKGETAGVLAIIRDITEREQISANIKYLKEYNEKIVDNIPSALLALDRNLYIKSINRSYREMWQLGDEDVEGKNIKEFFPHNLLEEVGLIKAFEQVINTGQPCKLYEVKYVSSEHPPKLLNLTITGFRHAREVTLILIVEDVTERARLTEGLREKNKELEDFIYIVSHDLKSPIVSMQGFTSLLFNEYHDQLGKEGKKYLERIKVNTFRMESLISDLLNLSKIGRVASVFRDISSLEIVKRICSGLKPRLEKDRIEISIEDNLPIVHCDEEKMYQIFENLIINAIKFMGDTKNPKIEIGCEVQEDFHQFYIRDNGIGIDKKYHRRIFEVFQRLNEIEDEKGTGIGLVIVERIVELHGGRAWVESEKGKGSTFYFTIRKDVPPPFASHGAKGGGT